MKFRQHARARRSVQPRQRGFTLIEVMIVVAIIGILAAVALPAYVDYLRRGKLVDGTNALSAQRARMEQYYQDNRKYDGDGSPCASIAAAGAFSFDCEYGKIALGRRTPHIPARRNGRDVASTKDVRIDFGVRTASLPPEPP